MIETEKLEIGGVKWEVYAYYAKSIGWLFSSGTFLLYFVYQVHNKIYPSMLRRQNAVRISLDHLRIEHV